MSEPPLEQAVARHLSTMPIADVMRTVAQVSEHDRYQASRGIERAAELVAEKAAAAGLDDVAIERFAADGATRWWSFEAPLSWTPLVARLEVRTGGGRVLDVDHARQPCSVATYSAATPPGGIAARLANVHDRMQEADLAGAVAVLPRDVFARPEVLDELANACAAGFVTDAASRREAPHGEHPGRIELDPRTPLFGFSVTSGQLARLASWADCGAEARVTIALDRSAPMPVVTAVLPGTRSEEEVWLIAHLCHPRPSANDNASGVAALLGVAASHVAARRADAAWATDRTLRFVWGPEFVGTAAVLHRHMASPGGEPPAAVVNLDMVGEDQAVCGGPFLVERAPDCQPGLIGPFAEHVVGEVFARTRRQRGCWRPTTFAGLSDHALFADPRIGSPAVHLHHAPDRFNHSAGDTLDKVSPVELRRAAAAAAALAHLLAYDGAAAQPLLIGIVDAWCERERLRCGRLARRHLHVQGGAWAAGLVRHAERRHALMRSLVDGAPMPAAAEPADPQDGAERLAGRWAGPFNARAMIADLPRADRLALTRRLRADRRHHAVLVSLAIRLDGRRTAAELVRDTSYALGGPISEQTARPLLAALVDSGWAATAAAGYVRASGP